MGDLGLVTELPLTFYFALFLLNVSLVLGTHWNQTPWWLHYVVRSSSVMVAVTHPLR
jgi:hypothetical protein